MRLKVEKQGYYLRYGIFSSLDEKDKKYVWYKAKETKDASCDKMNVYLFGGKTLRVKWGS